VPTRIVFVGGGAKDLMVQAEPAAVFDAVNEAHGQPAKLTAEDGSEVYVNPGAIALWGPEEL
jgi:hypothetical protein